MIDWIEEFEKEVGEKVRAVVIGEMGSKDYNEPEGVDYKPAIGKVMTREEAIPFASYEFDAGFVAPGCTAVWAYSYSWIMYVVKYDGSTSWHKIPRNPTIGVVPEMP